MCEEYMYMYTIFSKKVLLVRTHYIKRLKMVSKSTTILSFLLPIAMVFGTTLAISFYKHDSLTLLYLYAGGGLLLCMYVLILRTEHHRSVR